MTLCEKVKSRINGILDNVLVLIIFLNSFLLPATIASFPIRIFSLHPWWMIIVVIPMLVLGVIMGGRTFQLIEKHRDKKILLEIAFIAGYSLTAFMILAAHKTLDSWIWPR